MSTVKAMENLRKTCLDVIMNKQLDHVTLLKRVCEEFSGSDSFKEKLYVYVKYVFEDAKNETDVMWCVNSIAHFVDFDFDYKEGV